MHDVIGTQIDIAINRLNCPRSDSLKKLGQSGDTKKVVSQFFFFFSPSLVFLLLFFSRYLPGTRIDMGKKRVSPHNGISS